MNRESSLPLYKQLRDLVLNDIKSGSLLAGDRLSTVKQLAEKHQVSNGTAGKTVIELIKEGVLCHKRGLGVFVSETALSKKSICRSHVLSFLVWESDDLSHSFLSKLIKSCSVSCREMGCKFQIINVPDYNLNNSSELYKAVTKKEIDGLLIPNPMKLKEIVTLKDWGVPFVWINNRLQGEDLNYIASDYFKGGELAAKYLVKLGHKRIGFIRGSADDWGSEAMLLGYRGVLDKYDLPFDESLVKIGDWNEETGYRLTGELITKKTTAIFSADDIMAVGAIRALLDLKIKVPEEVAVVGYGNLIPPSLCIIPITTVDIHLEEMGRLGVEMLLKQLNNEKFYERKLILSPKLIIRNSSEKFQNLHTFNAKGELKV